MKIAFVNDTFLEGRGADTVVYEIAKRLGKRHEVFVISADSDFPEDNFKVLRVREGKKLLTGDNLKDSFLYLPNILKFRKAIKKFHDKYKFDILNVHHSALNPVSGGFPCIVTWNGSPISENKVRAVFNKFLLKSLKKNKVSITISKFLRDGLSDSADLKDVRVIYYAADEGFKPTYKDKGYMFFVGRLEKHKRVDELIRLSKDLDHPLYLAGSGPLENKLKNYARKINAGKVKFMGRVSREDLIKLYQECSFFASGSRWEGFGLIFLEAASCAKPSIGYSRGSIPEVISEGKSGFLVNSFSEMKEKAEMLIKDKNLRKSMGKEALKFSNKFSWEDCVKKYEEIFKEVTK